jgi:hypothetical protein
VDVAWAEGSERGIERALESGIDAGSTLDRRWIIAGSMLDRRWIDAGSPLDHRWIGAGSSLDRRWIIAGIDREIESCPRPWRRSCSAILFPSEGRLRVPRSGSKSIARDARPQDRPHRSPVSG